MYMYIINMYDVLLIVSVTGIFSKINHYNTTVLNIVCVNIIMYMIVHVGRLLHVING